MSLEKIVVADTTTYDSWCPTDDLPCKRCKLIEIVGNIVHEDSKQVTVALMRDYDEPPIAYGSLVVIPKVAIIERGKLCGTTLT
jgi:hypothetical protein